MPKPSVPKPVFVSHAHLDEKLVSQFVDQLLKVGCGLTDDEIFYSSGPDGIPAGSNLLAHVQGQLAEGALVIAIVSPNYQTRPVCIAELGAAWASTSGTLLPIAVPGMARDDLEGVLDGTVIYHLDNRAKLDEIHKRVGELPGIKVAATGTWNQAKEGWLAGVKDLAAAIPPPTTVTPDELAAAEAALEGTQAALAATQAENQRLSQQIADYNSALDDTARRAALLPVEETERFNILLQAAQEDMKRLKPIVVDAFYGGLNGGMAWPHWGDDDALHREAQRAVNERELSEAGDETLVPNLDIGDNADAAAALAALEDMLGKCSVEFEDWFKAEHRLPPDLSLRKTWDLFF